MKLALVSPLPPLASPAATTVAAIIPHLRGSAEVRLLPHARAQVDPALAEVETIDPCCDLPHLLRTGAVDVPVYFVTDDLLHAHQVRFIREYPGLLVLLSPGVHTVIAALTEASGDLPAYRELLIEEHGASASNWPERFLWRSDVDRVRRRIPLTGVLCRRSLGVLATPSNAERLRKRHPDVPVVDLPDLDDPAAVAATILTVAQQAMESPREIAPLAEPNWPTVEIVIVAYNCRRIISPALQSLAEQDYPNYTCTVVDNASSDGTAEFVREHFPFVDVVSPGSNLGFAGGNNFAFERSTADYIVLFNQDAVARRDLLRELVRVAERDPEIGAVGAKMLMLRCPTVFNSTGIVVNEAGFAVDRQIGEKDTDPSPVPVNVFGACGGAKLIRTSVIRTIGGFDDAFFMYFEDVDFCWRMRLAGKQIVYAPLAVVHHDWHGDLDAGDENAEGITAKTQRRRLLCERNRLQCLFKNYEFVSLLRVIRRLRRYDKVRLGWVKASIAAGREVGYFTMVGRAIRAAWRWNVLHLPGLLARRRRTQRVRRVSDQEMVEFIERGVSEPSFVGDLEIIQDHSSARPSPRLLMGVTDHRSLGPGWYGVEPVPGEEWDLRWSKGQAWLYLASLAPARTLKLRVSRGRETMDLRVWLGGNDLGRRPVVSPEMNIVEFPLANELPPQELIEVRLECDTFRPSEHDEGEDHRDLGVRVAEVWLE